MCFVAHFSLLVCNFIGLPVLLQQAGTAPPGAHTGSAAAAVTAATAAAAPPAAAPMAAALAPQPKKPRVLVKDKFNILGKKQTLETAVAGGGAQVRPKCDDGALRVRNI